MGPRDLFDKRMKAVVWGIGAYALIFFFLLVYTHAGAVGWIVYASAIFVTICVITAVEAAFHALLQLHTER